MATPMKKPIDLAIPLGTSAFIEVNKLAVFMLEEYPDQIEAGESAVDVAIKMLQAYRLIQSNRIVLSHEEKPT